MKTALCNYRQNLTKINKLSRLAGDERGLQEISRLYKRFPFRLPHEMTQSRSAIMNSFAELCKENLSSNYRCEAKTRLNLSRVRFSPFQYVFAGKREIVIKSVFVIITRMNINLDSYKSKTFILFKKKRKYQHYLYMSNYTFFTLQLE